MNIEKPELTAHEDEWRAYAKHGQDRLISELIPHLMKNFDYSKRRVKKVLHSGFGSTVKAEAKKYDLYFRLFPNPKTIWPRETLVIARINFKAQRKGHGRKLLTMLADLSAEIGYDKIAIETTTSEASEKFAERFGFQRINKGNDWIGSVTEVREALEQAT